MYFCCCATIDIKKMCNVDIFVWGNLIAHIHVDLYQYMQRHTTLKRLYVVGQNHDLELTLIFMMILNISHINF